jgi:hypothetical protein
VEKVWQVFDRETDGVVFNGVPFATEELANRAIDRTFSWLLPNPREQLVAAEVEVKGEDHADAV